MLSKARQKFDKKERKREEKLMKKINGYSDRKLLWLVFSRVIYAILIVLGAVWLWGYVDGQLLK